MPVGVGLAEVEAARYWIELRLSGSGVEVMPFGRDVSSKDVHNFLN